MRDLFGVGTGIVMACLTLIVAPYSWAWWILLGGGILMVVVSIGDFLVRYFTPKKSPTLRCSFDQGDIGGCVCPNIILNRRSMLAPDRLKNLPMSNASSAPTFATGFPSPYTQAIESTGTVVPTAPIYFYAALPSEKGTYYRIKVSAEHGTVFSCKGRLESLKRGSQKIIPEPIDLPFAPAKNPDHANKTIHVEHPEHVDFLFIANDNHVEVTPPNFYGPSNVEWSTLFSVPGDYVFDIGVLSPTSQASITILFHWTGKRDTSRLVAMN